jgi:hypothetical protein
VKWQGHFKSAVEVTDIPLNINVLFISCKNDTRRINLVAWSIQIFPSAVLNSLNIKKLRHKLSLANFLYENSENGG